MGGAPRLCRQHPVNRPREAFRTADAGTAALHLHRRTQCVEGKSRETRVKLQTHLPTIRDVAKAAGVSPMTVSRVLNQPELVALPTRTRVQAAIRELDYVVNELAR